MTIQGTSDQKTGSGDAAGAVSGDGSSPVDAKEGSSRVAPRRGVSHALLSRPLSVVALLWLGGVVGACLIAPLVAPFGQNQQNLAATFQGPSASHLLGTDGLGRDILSRLLFGGRITLQGVLLATVIAVVLGSSIGIVSGYFRGAIDGILSSISDMLMSIPVLVILLSIAAVTSQNISILMFAVGILLSAPVYRVFRAATLEVREELFVTAARTSGLTDLAILRRHILPRLGSILVVQTAVIASLALVTQVGLGYLNIDVRAPAASWGGMVSAASQTIYTSAWPLVPPAIVITLTVLAFSVIGDVAQQARTGRTAGRQRGRRAFGLNPEAPMAIAARPNDGRRTDSGPSVVPLDSTALALRDVSVAVPTDAGGWLTLVDSISFEIGAGEIVGLVGESGAGKSVTARAILGVLPSQAAVSGSVWYRGTELLRGGEKAYRAVRGKRIAFVGQDPMTSLSPTWRIGTVLAENVRRQQGVGRKEAKRIARDLLAKVRFPNPESVEKLYPHQISGGMAQRVVIAIALAGNPDLIIADEPTTALDVTVQMEVLGLLKSLQQERSLAMLLVTHDWGVVADICDRAVVMYAGQVVEDASAQQIFTEPKHPYSAALRSADPHSQQVGQRLQVIPGTVPPPGSWPPGCRFASRCVHCIPACQSAPIELLPGAKGGRVRCIRASEIGILVP
jgi:peptide/nickel transport system permease protein